MAFEQDEIAALVREVVSRTMGGRTGRPIVSEETLRELELGSTYELPANALVTPLARQVALEKRIRLVEPGSASDAAARIRPAPVLRTPETAGGEQRFVALGADHGGYGMKEKLKAMVAEAGYGVIDCGTNSAESVDYPDFAYAVAQLVANGRAWRGIIVDGAGIGSCMAANKVPGVRAAMCYDQATAVNSREHNNANVLTLGAGLIGPSLAAQIVGTWLKTDFGGGRHARRVDKIDAIGARFMK
ncbi:MAG TPA: ribose 5-phosphate isomerase B [Anaerolineae bacterium]|jgi:ribose 5-phosphate isomerase B|nr:ribose 5-phosphate isomerase B [Anaerolineae bacterium]